MGKITLGVISDTHGLLRPQAIRELQGVDRILHAGDVGKEEILGRLEEIAPLTVVRGNVDGGQWGARLPQTEAVQTNGLWLYMIHNLQDLDLNPKAAGFAAVIYGHSHEPAIDWREGVLYLNPGSAGPRRFRLPVSMARLEIVDEALFSTLVSLEE